MLAIAVSVGRAVWARGQRSVTETGCLERDAASRVPIFKLVTKTASGTAVYRLTAASAIDFAPEVGHVVEVTGALTERDPNRPQDEAVISVRSMRKIADRCP